MSIVTKTLIFGALLLGAADARRSRFGQRNGVSSAPAAATQETIVSRNAGIAAEARRGGRGGRSSRDGRGGFFGRNDDLIDEDSSEEAQSWGGRGRGRGGRGKGGLIALEKIEACEADILLTCSLEFDFDLDALKQDLAGWEAAKEAAKEEFLATGEKPQLEQLLPETVSMLKAVRECLHEQVKDTLEEGSACLAAITKPTKDEDADEEVTEEEVVEEVVEEINIVEEIVAEVGEEDLNPDDK